MVELKRKIMKHNIKINYDGKYPSLCMGHLFVTVDGVEYDFGEYCLKSGGCYFVNENGDDDVEEGEWSVKFPADFPK